MKETINKLLTIINLELNLYSYELQHSFFN